ncbi:MAG: lipopolysaccharide biosynthesis regulator YciM [Gammaproteobacteria bacterium]|jgi:lipopolysaccharide biosynthesis regulator YciM
MDLWLFSLILFSIFIGWIIGYWRPFKRSNTDSHTENYSESYAKGLNYLLSDDSENAIKIFSEIIDVNPNTIEIHLSLGNLFRSKGEVDRAIKVHQNLLARPDLDRKQRNMIIEELANDYLKAGLLDRAEKLFKEMIQLKTDNLVAYRRLLDLYITEKSWGEAVECAQALYDRKDSGAANVLSQCLCGVAEAAVLKGNRKKAREALMRALDVDECCVRAALLLIEWYLTDQNLTAAKKVFQRLVKRSPEYMELYLDPAKKIFLQGKDSTVYQKFLQQQYALQPSTQLAIALLEFYATTKKPEKARQFLSEVLEKSPSFGAYDFALRFLQSDSTQLADTWEGLSNFLKAMQNKKLDFVCTQCGYESHAIQWNCPSCRNWSSMKPV